MTMTTNTFDAMKQYKRIQYHQDRDLTDGELNEMQEIAIYERRVLLDRVYAQGAILDGLTATGNGIALTIVDGLIYLDGHAVQVLGAVLTCAGVQTIWVDVFRRAVTVDIDPTLVNPLTGEPTAEREQWVASLQTRDTTNDPLPTGATGRTVVEVMTYNVANGTVVILQPQSLSPNGHLGVGGTAHPAATLEQAGFMSAGDKAKLDGVQIGARAGGRSATLVVAAGNAGTAAKAAADYVCDGVDDQVELNTARATLQALGGGKLVLTEGTFTLSGTMKLCSNLLMEGQGQATVLKVSVPQSFNWGMLTTDESVEAHPKNITIRDLALDGSRPTLPANSNGASAIHFGGVDGGLLENLDAAHFQYAGTAIYVAGCTNVVVRNCRSHDNDGCGIMLHDACRHCLVEGNVFYRNGVHGISLAIAQDCAILNNVCWNNGLAVDNSYANIYLGYDAAWCNLQGNTCRYHDTAIRPKAGIEIVNGSGTMKNLVTNNDLLNGGVTPLVNGDAETVTAAGNRVGTY